MLFFSYFFANALNTKNTNAIAWVAIRAKGSISGMNRSMVRETTYFPLIHQFVIFALDHSKLYPAAYPTQYAVECAGGQVPLY
jgi:hypothetical protein